MSTRSKRMRIRDKAIHIRARLSGQAGKQKHGSRKLMKRMSRDHLDVLQNIEFALVSAYRNDRDVDDCVVAEALNAAIHDAVPDEPRARSLVHQLASVREFRADMADNIWRDALRTVLQSVQRHSTFKRGSTEYLDFVSTFIL